MPAVPDHPTGPAGWEFAVACTREGLHPRIQQRILEFQDLAAFLDRTITEARIARSDHDLARSAELLFRILGLLSDVVLTFYAGRGAGLGVSYLKDIGVMIADGARGDLGPEDALAFSTRVKVDALREGVGPNHPAWKVLDGILVLMGVADEVVAIARSRGGARGIDAGIATAEIQLARMRPELRRIEEVAAECGITAGPESRYRTPGPRLRAY